MDILYDSNLNVWLFCSEVKSTLKFYILVLYCLHCRNDKNKVCLKSNLTPAEHPALRTSSGLTYPFAAVM